MNKHPATVLVVGATGSIGRLVVAEALAEGHAVRALVRDLRKAKALPPGAQAVVADLTQPQTLAAAVDGVDAIVFAHGSDGAGKLGAERIDYGGARTEFRYGSAQVARLMPVYENNPAHSFLRMLDAKNGLAVGDPARMAARIIESADIDPAQLRLVLGSQALESTLTTLRQRIAGFEAQTALAASTDFPPGE